MGTLYLVRHGQASFGADDYDRLSPLGHQQAERLGHWFARQGLTFEAVYRGTLRRQRETVDGIARGLGGDARVPTAHEHTSLNEVNGEALIETVRTEPLPPAHTPEGYRTYFRLLREGWLAWMDGRVEPEGMPRHADYLAGIVATLDQIRAQHTGDVLLVSSGGPIGQAVGHVLGTPPATSVELNLKMKNSALTEFAFTPKGHRLVSFNHLPHLPLPEHADWITHA